MMRSTANRRLSTPVMLGAAGLLVSGLLSMPILDWFDGYNMAIATEQDKVDRLTHIRHEQLALQREQTALEQHWTLRTDSRLQAELDQLLEQLHLRQHVQTFRPAGVTPAGALEEVLLDLTVTDLSQPEFIQLLRAIEQLPPPLHIKSVTWRRQTNTTHTHEITIIIAAYQRAPGALPSDGATGHADAH